MEWRGLTFRTVEVFDHNILMTILPRSGGLPTGARAGIAARVRAFVRGLGPVNIAHMRVML